MHQTLNDEELRTLFAEAERIVNSRPLAPLNADSIDRLALTPNDLIILRSNATGILPALLTDGQNRCWRQVNYSVDLFLERWIRNTYPYCNADKSGQDNAEILRRDVALVTTDTFSRARWSLGIVDNCLSSEDGLLRTVVVRTSNGIYKRDVRKIF